MQAVALAKDVSIKGWKSTPHNNYPIQTNVIEID
jgi:hypothetical protein